MDICKGLNVSKDIFQKMEKKDANFPDQPKENDEGNKEYKWKLLDENYKDRNGITKIEEGLNKYNSKTCNIQKFQDGKAVYLIGVQDNGFSIGVGTDELYQTLSIIDEASKIINCKIKNVRIYEKDGKYISTIRIIEDGKNKLN